MSKNGFTLAEVLITLGVVGVISAMTLPTLVQNYKNHVAETRLKKFYSTFNQAIQRSVVENGDFENWDYFMGSNFSKKDKNGNYTDNSAIIEENFDKYLAKYIKIVNKKRFKNVEVADGDKLDFLVYYLPDGSSFAYSMNENREIYYFISDIEKCIKLSLNEQSGSCRFSFQFYPIYNNIKNDWKYLYKKGLEPYYYKWDGQINSLYNNATFGCNSSNPHYCTGLIHQNGWKIPKDYPKKIKF